MHSFYNTHQLKLMLKIGLHICIVFIVLNIIMRALTVYAPNIFWVPKQFFGIDFVKENYKKTQGVIDYYQDRKMNGSDSLIVILGLSSASEGISINELKRVSARGYNVLSLSGAGRNFQEIDLYSKALLNSDLVPELVIFAINPFHLMDVIDPHETPVTVIEKYSVWQLLFGWFNERRNDIRHQLDMASLMLQTNVFRFFNNRMSAFGSISWSDNTSMNIQALGGSEQWESKLKEYGDRGYYNIKNYQESREQLQTFAGSIRALEKRGSQVIVVLMPEHSSLFASVPKGAFEVVLASLRAQLPDNSLPPIIDLRQVSPDGHFNDISHMNKLGRKSFSGQLDNLLVQYLDPKSLR